MHELLPAPEVGRKPPNAAWQPAARAARGVTASLLELQRTAGNRAVTALLAPRQSRVLARCGSGRCTCGGECRTNRHEDEEDDRQRARAGSVQLQRSVGEWFDAIGETISEGVETVEQTVESAKTKLDTLGDLASLPHCPAELGAALPLPGLIDWLDNEGLEAVRNEGEVLSRTKKPSGGDRGATLLLKQVLHAWGCEKLGRDLLPKHGSEGPFGPETQEAVKQFQLWSWLPVDGVVGPRTLAALDKHMDVPAPSPTPGSDGGSTEQGKSNWSVFRSPAAHIYFKTDEGSLDADDERILEAMADHIALPARGAKEITLEVVGYADKRDSVSYNMLLSAARAKAVHDHLKELLKDRPINAKFKDWKVKGEIERPQVGETEEELKPFRRVDVYVRDEVFRERPSEPELSCLEPTTKWKAQLRNMQGLGDTAFGVVDIAMAHPDSTGVRWMMTYKYAGVGKSLSPKSVVPLPSFSGDSGFEPFETSVPLSITEFAGPAAYTSEGVVIGSIGASVDRLWIKGIEDHGATADPDPIKWDGEPSGFSVGITATGGRLTYFKRCEEAPPAP